MFLVIEGIDGCGKGTQSELAQQYLSSIGSSTLMKYPDRSTPIGRLIDRWLKGGVALHTRSTEHAAAPFYPAHPSDNALAMQGLLTANKVEVEKNLQQNLEKGHVVSDRYTPSAVSYGCADGLGFRYMMESHHYPLTPADLIVFLDIPAEVGLERIKGRVGDDTYGSVFQRLYDARVNYHMQIQEGLDHWVIIDGTKPVDVVAQEIRQHINLLLARG